MGLRNFATWKSKYYHVCLVQHLSFYHICFHSKQQCFQLWTVKYEPFLLISTNHRLYSEIAIGRQCCTFCDWHQIFSLEPELCSTAKQWVRAVVLNNLKHHPLAYWIYIHKGQHQSSDLRAKTSSSLDKEHQPQAFIYTSIKGWGCMTLFV